MVTYLGLTGIFSSEGGRGHWDLALGLCINLRLRLHLDSYLLEDSKTNLISD